MFYNIHILLNSMHLYTIQSLQSHQILPISSFLNSWVKDEVIATSSIEAKDRVNTHMAR